jgi:hypothetical protein
VVACSQPGRSWTSLLSTKAMSTWPQRLTLTTTVLVRYVNILASTKVPINLTRRFSRGSHSLAPNRYLRVLQDVEDNKPCKRLASKSPGASPKVGMWQLPCSLDLPLCLCAWCRCDFINIR